MFRISLHGEIHVFADPRQHAYQRIDGEFFDLVIYYVGNARPCDVRYFGCGSLRLAFFIHSAISSMSCRFSRIEWSIWASAWANRRFASFGGKPRSMNTLPPAFVR